MKLTKQYILQTGWQLVMEDTVCLVAKRPAEGVNWYEIFLDELSSEVQIMKAYPTSLGGYIRETLYHDRCYTVESFKLLNDSLIKSC